MRRRFRMLLSAAVAGVVALGGPVAAQSPAARPPAPSLTRSATASAGRILGRVTDIGGTPLRGAVVSALGSTTAFVVTDGDGRFELGALPPGPYVLGAHLLGFAAAPREVVEVRPGGRVLHGFLLRRASDEGAGPPASAAARPILAAGAAPTVNQPDEASWTGSGGEEPAPESSPHDHGETAWRLRHARRSVLKSAGDRIEPADEDPEEFGPGTLWRLGRAVGSSARLAAALFDELPFSGQLNLLTTTSADRTADLFQLGRLPRGVAYLSLGAPAGRYGDWRVQGAMTSADGSAWVLGGTYSARLSTVHTVDVGLSYSTQRYERGNPVALAAVNADTRNVGAVYLFDRWSVSRHLSVAYGGRYAWYDYLQPSGLLSPRVSVTIWPAARTRIHAVVSQRLLAPGAEEFLPPSSGVWLPPERSFAPVSPGAPFRPERARHLEVALERDLADGYVVSVHGISQAVTDQIVTLFGVRWLDAMHSDLGHYAVGSAGNVDASGWRVSLSRGVAGRVRGSVGYSVMHAQWDFVPVERAVATWARSAARDKAERFHDVTTSVATEIPETGTKVFVLYRINSAFARREADAAPGVDGRFDLQVKQGVPFLPFSEQWELLVAVRNLFREPAEDGSAYDELLVIRPPKRIVGGLMVRF